MSEYYRDTRVYRYLHLLLSLDSKFLLNYIIYFQVILKERVI